MLSFSEEDEEFGLFDAMILTVGLFVGKTVVSEVGEGVFGLLLLVGLLVLLLSIALASALTAAIASIFGSGK